MLLLYLLHRHMSVRLVCQAVFYTGAPGQRVKAQSWMETVRHGKSKYMYGHLNFLATCTLTK